MAKDQKWCENEFLTMFGFKLELCDIMDVGDYP